MRSNVSLLLLLFACCGFAQEQPANGSRASDQSREKTLPASADIRPGPSPAASSSDTEPGASLVQLDPLPLQVLRTVTVRDYGQRGVNRTDCDAAGNIFVPARPQGDRFPAGVMRISSDGERLTPYLLSDIPELRTDSSARPPMPRNYAIAPDGDIYMIIVLPRSSNQASAPPQRETRGFRRPSIPNTAIAVFTGDGKFRRLIRLGADYAVQQVVPLASERLLISGRKRQGDNAENFVGLFGQDGELVREFDNIDNKNAPRQRGSRFSMSRGFTHAGEDGNIYILPAGPRGSVQIFSALGEFVSEVKIKWPEKDALMAMKLAGGFFAAEFATIDECMVSEDRRPPHCTERPAPASRRTIQLFDISTGELVRKYDAPLALGRLACYTLDAFTFLRTNDKTKQLEMVIAASR